MISIQSSYTQSNKLHKPNQLNINETLELKSTQIQLNKNNNKLIRNVIELKHTFSSNTKSRIKFVNLGFIRS